MEDHVISSPTKIQDVLFQVFEAAFDTDLSSGSLSTIEWFETVGSSPKL